MSERDYIFAKADRAFEEIDKAAAPITRQARGLILPQYKQLSHAQVPAYKMEARALASRNGQMAARMAPGPARDRMIMAGKLQRGTSRRPGAW